MTQKETTADWEREIFEAYSPLLGVMRCGELIGSIRSLLKKQEEEIIEKIEQHMIQNAGQYELYGEWGKLKASLNSKEREEK